MATPGKDAVNEAPSSSLLDCLKLPKFAAAAVPFLSASAAACVAEVRCIIACSIALRAGQIARPAVLRNHKFVCADRHHSN